MTLDHLSRVAKFESRGNGAGNVEEDVNPYGEIRGKEQRRFGTLDKVLYLRNLVIPAGCADDHRGTGLQAGCNVVEHRVWSREIDDYIHSKERLTSERLVLNVLRTANRSNRMPALASDLRNQ